MVCLFHFFLSKIAVQIILWMHVASNLGLETSVFLEHGLQTDCFLLLDHDPLFPYQPEVINLELFLTGL